MVDALGVTCSYRLSFYPLFLFGVYNAVGPWVIGEMMHGHLGVLFVHGMYLKQHWIPGSLSYYYGIMQAEVDISTGQSETIEISFNLDLNLRRMQEEEVTSGSLGHKGGSVDCYTFQDSDGNVGVLTLESGKSVYSSQLCFENKRVGYDRKFP
ncbi:Transmembrane protein 62 [Desmophyllum pertusum]|uniref:Transmembrane protein 62 n=1 Tax=Desmophyllum pertusum TaxID=174260 RepID=A0A9W9YB01_9CNID|nr:Transmembrane protein 62 [Desmophyllum pertusum]